MPQPHLEKLFLFSRGFRPKPWLTFCLATKSKQKGQDCAHFTRKTNAQLAETVKLAPSSLKQDSFWRQLHLFFGSPDEVARLKTVCDQYVFDFIENYSMNKCVTYNKMIFNDQFSIFAPVLEESLFGLFTDKNENDKRDSYTGSKSIFQIKTNRTVMAYTSAGFVVCRTTIVVGFIFRQPEIGFNSQSGRISYTLSAGIIKHCQPDDYAVDMLVWIYDFVCHRTHFQLQSPCVGHSSWTVFGNCTLGCTVF